MRVLLVGLMSFALGCMAQATESTASVESKGSAAEQWLKLQREGEQASPHPQTATVVEQEKAHERWLKTYNHVIPDQFQVQENGSR